MADKGKAVFRVVINGPQQAIFDELTRTDRALGAIFNARMHTTGLKPVTGGVEVTLTVDDMPLGTKTATEMQRGGGFILKSLKAIVETGRPPFSTRLMYAMFGAMEFVLPKKSKTANWPLEKR